MEINEEFSELYPDVPEKWSLASRPEDVFPPGAGSSRLNYEYVIWLEKKLYEIAKNG